MRAPASQQQSSIRTIAKTTTCGDTGRQTVTKMLQHVDISFVLDRTSLDLKISPCEKTSQLTFRPIYRDIPDLKYTVRHGENGEFEVQVVPRLFSIFEMTEES